MAVNYGSGCSEITTTKKWHEGVEKVPFLKRIQMEDFLFNDCIRAAAIRVVSSSC